MVGLIIAAVTCGSGGGCVFRQSRRANLVNVPSVPRFWVWYKRPMRLALATLALASLAFGADSRPKVRAITAFINIDPKTYSAEVEGTVKFLDGARSAYRAAGFEVEGVRIVTQPFPKYIGGMKRDDALTFLHKLDDLSTKLRFAPNIGAAMLADGDDSSLLDLLATAFSETRLNASLVIAGEDGIHWRAIREAAKLIRNTSQRSPHGRGNFNFAATAMMKPYGPFYPGAYHLGTGRTFAVGLEGPTWWPRCSRNTASRAKPRSSCRRRSPGTCAMPRRSPRAWRRPAGGPTPASTRRPRR